MVRENIVQSFCKCAVQHKDESDHPWHVNNLSVTIRVAISEVGKAVKAECVNIYCGRDEQLGVFSIYFPNSEFASLWTKYI